MGLIDTEREEGEIIDVDLNDDYEDIVSSDEEINLRQRMEELEARNLELEKIASISSAKTCDYDLGYGTQNYINLVDDLDDYNCYRPSSKYEWESRHLEKAASRRKNKHKVHSRSSKYERKKERIKSRSNKKSKKDTKNRSKYSSSDDEGFQLDRNELKAALKRDVTSVKTINSKSLRDKLIGVQQCVAEFISTETKEEQDFEDFSASMEILELLDTLHEEKIIAKDDEVIKVSDESEEEDVSVSLEEQELRLIALKSAILKKHEARKKRKIIESRPYSPTDTDIIMENPTGSKMVDVKSGIEPENMEISPAVSPAMPDKTLQPVDMELDSDDSKSPLFFMENERQNSYGSVPMWFPTNGIPLPPEPGGILISNEDISSYSIFKQGFDMNTHLNTTDDDELLQISQKDCSKVKIESFPHPPLQVTNLQTPVETKSLPSPTEDEEESALRALLLAKLSTSKSKPVLQDSSCSTLQVASKNNEQKLQECVKEQTNEVADVSLEAEHLRNLLLMSLNKKKAGQRKDQKENKVQTTVNLKDAVKRIKNRTRTKSQSRAKEPNNNKNVCDSEYVLSTDTKTIDKTDNAITNKDLSDRSYVITENEDHQPTIEPVITETSVENCAKTSASSSKIFEDELKFSCEVTNAIEPVLNTNAKLMKSPALTKVPKNVQKRKITLAATAIKAQPQKKQKLVEIKKSKIISNHNPKPVQKLIIQLQNSDSETDLLFDDDYDNSSTMTGDVDSYFDNASPASIAMDSPICSPCSPIYVNNSSMNVESAIDDSTSDDVNGRIATAPVETKLSASNQSTATTSAFQQQLDEFLKSARTKMEEMEKTKILKKKISDAKAAMKPVCSNTSATTTPLVVRHLPMSAQLEYRRLVNRIDLLEKKKQLKQKVGPIASSSTTSKNIKDISVTISNDQKSAVKTIVTNTANRVISANRSTDSLVKQVLVKNVEKTQQLKQEQQKKQDMDNAEIDSLKNKISLSSAKTDLDIVPSKTIISPRDVSSTIYNIIDLLVNNKPADVIKVDTVVPSESTTLNEIDKIHTISNAHENVFNTSAEHKIEQVVQPLAKCVITTKTQEIVDDAEHNTNLKKYSISELNTFSETEKMQKLNQSEENYLSHSSDFLRDLDSMYTLVCLTQQEKAEQSKLEEELEELKIQMERIQKSIEDKKSKLSNLYPAISDARKHVLKSRMKCIQLSSYCQDIGKSIIGHEYKIPNDKREIVIGKLKDISQETKKLKNMNKYKPDDSKDYEENLEKLHSIKDKDKCDVQVDIEENVEASIVEKSTKEVVEQIYDDTLITSISPCLVLCPIKDVDPLIVDTLQTLTLPSCSKVLDNLENRDTTTIIATQNELKKVNKYESPLDHMNHKSITNPDAVLCPFQLMGQCDDKECSYQHLFS